MKDLKNKIKEKAFSLGADLFGVADLERFNFENSKTIPENLLDSFKRAISIAIAFPKTIFSKVENAPHQNSHHFFLFF